MNNVYFCKKLRTVARVSGSYLPMRLILLFILVSHCSCTRENASRNLFSVVFMTDIHLQPERGAVDGFTMALEAANDLKPDFILTGGDLVMDALTIDYERASSSLPGVQCRDHHGGVPTLFLRRASFSLPLPALTSAGSILTMDGKL
jgi:hypothetical protein